MRYGEHVEGGVGGTTHRQHYADGVFERLAGHYVAGFQVLFEQVVDDLAGVEGYLIVARVYGGYGGGAGYGHSHRFDGGGHGVGGEHSGAGALARTGDTLHADEFIERYLPLRVRANGFVHILYVDVLSTPVSGHYRSAIYEDGRNVAARDRHHGAGHVLVAGGDDYQAVHALAECYGLYRVCDHFPTYQRRLHALGAHGDAVADGDGSEQERHAAVRAQAFLDLPRLAVEVHVARGNVGREVADGYERLLHVVVVQTGGAKHGPRAGAVGAVGNDAALLLEICCDCGCHLCPSL